MIVPQTTCRWILFFLGILMIPFSVEAFIPQGPHLIELMTQKIKQPAGLVVHQTRKIIQDEPREAEVFQIEEKLVFSFPGRFRSDVTAGPHESIYIESKGRVIRIQDQVTVSVEKAGMDHYIDVLLYRNRTELLQQLQVVGMDVDTVFMERLDDAVVYVIGAPFKDGRVSTSLWIDQDTFFPKKYVLDRKDQLVEILYEDWQIISKTWYPMQIRIFLNQQLFSTIHASGIKLESRHSDVLFDIDGLAALYPPSAVQSETEDNIEALEENIEAFKKLYE